MSKPTRHRKRWKIRWLDPSTGKRRAEVFESYNEAVAAQARHRTEVDRFRRRLGRSKIATFGDLCSEWLETRRAMGKRSVENDASLIRAHLRPAFSELPIAQVDSPAVEALIGRLRSGTPGERKAQGRGRKPGAPLSPRSVQAVVAMVTSLLRYAARLGCIEAPPALPRIKVPPQRFRWLETPEEVQRFLRAAAADGPKSHAVYSVALFAGLRVGEIAGLRWSDVDLERRILTIQRSYDGPTKGLEIRHVPILDPLLPVLKVWRVQSPGAVVFPGSGGKLLTSDARIFDQVLQRVLKAAGLDPKHVTMHGLRHSFASYWMLSGGEPFKLQRAMGHKDQRMTQRYSHLAPSAFQDDMARLNRLAPAPQGKVVPLPNVG